MQSDGGIGLIPQRFAVARTQSSRFLSEVFGSGVQHIALATSDIFARPERSRRTVWSFCRYQKTTTTILKHASGFRREQIDRLKAYNIFYDREGKAEFFQFYTTSFEENFFFEIVERRGYKGFGAPNAPDPACRADEARAPPDGPPKMNVAGGLAGMAKARMVTVIQGFGKSLTHIISM